MIKKTRRGNGEGSIWHDTKRNRWTAKYVANGIRKTIYGKTREEVTTKLQKQLVNIKENKYIDKSKLTINNILEIILEEAEKSNLLKPNTLLRKRKTAEKISEMYIANIPIQQVNATQINDCLLGLVAYSNSYISKVVQLLDNTMNKALLLGIIDKNPFQIKGNIIKPKSKRPDKKVDALTVEEELLFRKMLERKDYKYKLVFYVCLETGMRISEVLSLRREDIDFKKNIIHVSRTLTKDINDRYVLGETTKTYSRNTRCTIK